VPSYSRFRHWSSYWSMVCTLLHLRHLNATRQHLREAAYCREATYMNVRPKHPPSSSNPHSASSTQVYILYDVHDRQRASPLPVNPTSGTSTCPWRLAPVPDIGSASRPQRHPLPPNDTRYRFVNEVRSRRATSSLNHHVLHVLFWPSWDLHDSGDFPPVVIWGRHPGRIFP
jgi:hypothetical protein